jgi:hypothetical protein
LDLRLGDVESSSLVFLGAATGEQSRVQKKIPLPATRGTLIVRLP